MKNKQKYFKMVGFPPNAVMVDGPEIKKEREAYMNLCQVIKNGIRHNGGKLKK